MLHYTKENRPFLSIVMPIKNNANTIMKAIQGLRAQTFTDWELILINNGSTDVTGMMIKAMVARDDRLRYHYLSDPRITTAKACREGIQMARGNYVTFIMPDQNTLMFDMERYIRLLSIKPDIEAVIGKAALSQGKNHLNRGLFIIRTDVLLDTAVLYSRLDDLSPGTLYRKLSKVDIDFGFVEDDTPLVATRNDSPPAALLDPALKRIRQFGRREVMAGT